MTLFHWDLPQALEDRGGWASRATVDAFRRYVTLCRRPWRSREELDHPKRPWVYSTLGHIEGVFAPGISDWKSGLAVAHHILLSHGKAVPILREQLGGMQHGSSPASRLPAIGSDSIQQLARSAAERAPGGGVTGL